MLPSIFLSKGEENMFLKGLSLYDREKNCDFHQVGKARGMPLL
jgi:hypothetical protein